MHPVSTEGPRGSDGSSVLTAPPLPTTVPPFVPQLLLVEAPPLSLLPPSLLLAAASPTTTAPSHTQGLDAIELPDPVLLSDALKDGENLVTTGTP